MQTATSRRTCDGERAGNFSCGARTQRDIRRRHEGEVRILRAQRGRYRRTSQCPQLHENIRLLLVHCIGNLQSRSVIISSQTTQYSKTAVGMRQRHDTHPLPSRHLLLIPYPRGMWGGIPRGVGRDAGRLRDEQRPRARCALRIVRHSEVRVSVGRTQERGGRQYDAVPQRHIAYLHRLKERGLRVGGGVGRRSSHCARV